MQQRREINEKIFIADAEKTFKNFDVKFNGQGIEVAEVFDFLGNREQKRLILKGDVGRGKTHLAQACNNHSIEHYKMRSEIISARRLYWLFRELESFECEYIYEKAMRRIWAAKVFIIDDLGNEKQTDTQIFNQNFIEILDEFEGKIIVTTNLSEKDMENIYGVKIVSRLYDDAKVIVLKGKDYRRSK
jgi:DNA replication protein DnaC